MGRWAPTNEDQPRGLALPVGSVERTPGLRRRPRSAVECRGEAGEREAQGVAPIPDLDDVHAELAALALTERRLGDRQPAGHLLLREAAASAKRPQHAEEQLVVPRVN